MKVVLELFHLLFCSSEVLLLLIPSPSGEALMKNGNQHVFFFMHITGPFFSLHPSFYFPFLSLSSSLFSFNFFNNFSLLKKKFFFPFFSLFLWDCFFLSIFFWFFHHASPVIVFLLSATPYLFSLLLTGSLWCLLKSISFYPTIWRQNQTWRKVPAIQRKQVAASWKRMFNLKPGLAAWMSIRPW